MVTVKTFPIARTHNFVTSSNIFRLIRFSIWSFILTINFWIRCISFFILYLLAEMLVSFDNIVKARRVLQEVKHDFPRILDSTVHTIFITFVRILAVCYAWFDFLNLNFHLYYVSKIAVWGEFYVDCKHFKLFIST